MRTLWIPISIQGLVRFPFVRPQEFRPQILIYAPQKVVQHLRYVTRMVDKNVIVKPFIEIRERTKPGLGVDIHAAFAERLNYLVHV
jgi:hypothetical protein